jgi:hypothetical protein
MFPVQVCADIDVAAWMFSVSGTIVVGAAERLVYPCYARAHRGDRV